MHRGCNYLSIKICLSLLAAPTGEMVGGGGGEGEEKQKGQRDVLLNGCQEEQEAQDL